MKRHIAWSNCKSVECLNLGVMTREMQRRLFAHAPKSAKSYKSRDGKTSYVGTKFLKHTQILVLVFQWCTISGYYCVFVCVSTPESPLITYGRYPQLLVAWGPIHLDLDYGWSISIPAFARRRRPSQCQMSQLRIASPFSAKLNGVIGGIFIRPTCKACLPTWEGLRT